MFHPSIVLLFLLILSPSTAVDTIAVNQSIKDGETIVSANENFELGFFSPGDSKNRYLGIWYKKISPRTVVWVANTENPVNSTSGVVMLNSERNLLLLSAAGRMAWSSNVSILTTDITPVAQLLDTGNLVIKDKDDKSDENFIWQSFDYPGNTLLPGVKLGQDFITGKERYLTSWRSANDPSPGDYTYRCVVIGNYPQIYKKKGSIVEERMGPWNGLWFAGLPNYKRNPVYSYREELIFSQNEMNFIFHFNSTLIFEKAILAEDGKLEFSHVINTQPEGWKPDLTIPLDNCDSYGLCGAYGSCNAVTFPKCACLKGFEPRSPEEWSFGDNWTSGCQRRVALDCGPAEGFLKFVDVKLPDTLESLFNESMNQRECEVACKNNCNCTAYAHPYITGGGGGCLLWFGDLIDIRVYPENGQDLFIRMAASELAAFQSGSSSKKRVVIIVSVAASAVVVVLAMILALYAWNKRKGRSNVGIGGRARKLLDKDDDGSSEKEASELPLFSLSKVSRATNNFSVDNKLGEGGFGPVYKGVLEEGREIAVKRLSKSSQQGVDEFKNEIICIAKLQHRNLVKLLGYCMQGDETMLIYEYMPNKSLDWFIFDDSKKSLLDWPQRFRIIHGIARGLLYLHQDSRLRIVHRDLKAANILLDSDMNPRISDFGLARMFRGHESEANTNKVVGTLGYISPEYAANGLFSVKSDVFSFGVLVLEIVSGKKNRGFSHEDHNDNLLGHAWRLYKEDKTLNLVDASLGESWNASEVLRSIHVGLLCVQHRAEDRPSMSSVVLMLGGEGSLPPPKPPGFFAQGIGSTSTGSAPSSINEVTVTEIEAR